MIAGIGTDITDIRRIEGLITKYGTVFLEKVFTPSEVDYCGKMAFPALHFAGRWAAKEAFYKALPLHCQPHALWKSIEVLSMPEKRKPFIVICSEKLKEMLEEENIRVYHVSISHEKNYCIASVLLEVV